MIIGLLAVVGLIFGSFINALVWRTYKWETRKPGANLDPSLAILSGRSMCPDCRHQLMVKDLVPLISWLVLRGRCRYCQRPISVQYPLVEAATAAVFILSYVFWPQLLSVMGQPLLFITWLAASVGLMALLVYDFKWMILPNRILYPTFFIALVGRLAYILLFATNKASSFESLALSLVIACGIFWLLFTLSGGRWIGFGDVRLGLISGSLLGSPAKSFLMIFMASLLGSLFVLPLVARGRKKMTTPIPFGPFLIIATSLALLFGDSLISWYKNHWL